DASTQIAIESAKPQEHLADSYIQNGLAAGEASDPSLAALWFSKALEIDQGNAHRELMDRIRLGDAFRRCPWPAPVDENTPDAVDPPTVTRSLAINMLPNGRKAVLTTEQTQITVDATISSAMEKSGRVLLVR